MWIEGSNCSPEVTEHPTGEAERQIGHGEKQNKAPRDLWCKRLRMHSFDSALFVFLRSTTVRFHADQVRLHAWRKSPSEFSLDSTRLRMVDDLLATHLRLGMRRDGVVELLGEPDDTPYFDHYDLVYHLGQERSLIGIDSEWLVIRLDDSRHVIELQVLRD
jgi:hypothetical protein